MAEHKREAIDVVNPKGKGPAFLVCPHASAYIPDSPVPGLGLDEEVLVSHRAYDLGVADLTHTLSQRLDAPAYFATVSRLWAELNRVPSAADFITDETFILDPAHKFKIPGNQNVTAEDRARRIKMHFDYHHTVYEALCARCEHEVQPTYFMDIHSFTPDPMGGAERNLIMGVIGFGHERALSPVTRVFLDKLKNYVKKNQALFEETYAKAPPCKAPPVIWDEAVCWNAPYDLRDPATEAKVMMHRYAKVTEPFFDYVTIETRNDWLRSPELVRLCADAIEHSLKETLMDAVAHQALHQTRQYVGLDGEAFPLVRSA